MVSPAHLPAPSPSDWQRYWAKIESLHSLQGVHVAWNADGDGVIPEAVTTTLASGAVPVPVFGVTSALGDAAKTAKLEAMLGQLVREHRIPFLGIGNEIDNEAPYPEVAALVSHLADVIHGFTSGTLVFTVFQYEHLLTLPNPAEYLSSVPSVDFVGFTSYPFLRYQTTVEVPDDYFAPIDGWVRTPYAFTELGWPSRQNFPGYPTLHGSEGDQVELIERFWSALIAGHPVTFASWSALHDLSDWSEDDPIEDFNQVFASGGLMANGSEAEKPGLASWISASSPMLSQGDGGQLIEPHEPGPASSGTAPMRPTAADHAVVLPSAHLYQLVRPSQSVLSHADIVLCIGAADPTSPTCQGGRAASATLTPTPASFLDLDFDPVSNELTLNAATLESDDVSLLAPLGGAGVDLTDLLVTLDTSQPAPHASVWPSTGAFSMPVPVLVSAGVAPHPFESAPVSGAGWITVDGVFDSDPTTGNFRVRDLTTRIVTPQWLPVSRSFGVGLSGVVELDLDGAPPLAPVVGAQRVGTTLSLRGEGLTPGSRLKAFLATSSGVVDVTPGGLAADATSPAQWSGRLPFPWPITGSMATSLGNGFLSVFVVRTDRQFSMSNSQGVMLIGNPGLAPQVPSILAIDDQPLSATSSRLDVATANVEGTLTADGAAVTTISGEGFFKPVVTAFSAAGNCGPSGGITPQAWTSSSVRLVLPSKCPIGPGSLQIVNAVGRYQASQAVAMPIGERIALASVRVDGSSIVVNGAGFNTLTVVNLFASSAGAVINAGGLDTQGRPRIPIASVKHGQFTFTRPAGLDPGAAFLEAINPPFIPFTSSGTGAGGSFRLP